MKVKCVRTDLREFPFSEEHRRYFRSWLRGAQIDKGFDDLKLGKEYIVYAITNNSGYSSYFVKTSDRPFFDFHFQPGPCFEIVENSVSQFWHFDARLHVDQMGNEKFMTTLAIREWIEQPEFLHRLIDGKSPEIETWRHMSEQMDAEAAKLT